MVTCLAVVFASDDRAVQALHDLWHMDEAEILLVHSATVMRRDDRGEIRCALHTCQPGLCTAISFGLDDLMGSLSGSIAVTAQREADTRHATADETLFTLHPGQSAVVAEISEVNTQALDAAMWSRGGRVYRSSCPTQTAVVLGDLSDARPVPRLYPNPLYA